MRNLLRCEAIGEEYRTHSLGQPLEREDSRGLLHPCWEAVVLEEDSTAELQYKNNRGDHGRCAAPALNDSSHCYPEHGGAGRAKNDEPDKAEPESSVIRDSNMEEEPTSEEKNKDLDQHREKDEDDLSNKETDRRHRRAAQTLECAVVALSRNIDC